MNDELEIATLNCWGLKFISQLTTERIRYIADELAGGTSDIVCLQELWQEKHWRMIRDRTRSRLPYAKYYYSGMMGSGLAILSKYPIIQTDMRPYTLNGRPQAFFRGDWFVGKGIASALIELPSKRICQVFNTHMHAPYNEKIDTYLCHRIAQGWELHKLLGMSVRAGYITFATGDFNSVPGSLVHQFLTMYLSDSFITLNPDFAEPDYSCSEEELIALYGVTCDVSTNTWRQLQAPTMRAKRLDYIFHDHRTNPISTNVIFQEVIPTVGCSASDHFGVKCRYKLAEGKPFYRPLSEHEFAQIDEQTKWYTAREKRHSTLRITHFWLSMIMMLVLAWTSSTSHNQFSRFIQTIFSLLIGLTGLLSGLIGSIFGWWELRSLHEFNEEMENARMLAVYSNVS